MKIRKGDSVVIIAGKDKGKTGTVLRVLPLTGRLVVSDANMRTKHVKATPQRPGQRISYEASIHSSNVMVVDPKSKKRTRIGFAIDDKGKKKRVARGSGDEIKAGKIPSKKDLQKAKKEDETEDVGTRHAESAAEDDSKKKETKTSKSKKPKKDEVIKTDKPEKKAFWKRAGIAADALEDAELEKEKGAEKDRSVPDESQRQTNRSHDHNS